MKRSGAWLAIVVCALTFFYRFNTLGGALGGLDDDHFMQLAYANQIRAGERPVRDFLGVSLQGVWPPLGFVASAAAQRVLGANLRSEAVFTAGVMAAAAAATFAISSRLASPGWAAITTLLSVLLAPKLYAFPKVVVFAAAAGLLMGFAQRPSGTRAIGLGVITAAAFLFRHDYAVYVGTGAAAAFVCTWRSNGPASVKHALLYAAVTMALLAPSLLFVQRHLGVRDYLEFARENSSREQARTQLARPFISLTADAEHNAEAGLYWLITLLPIAAIVRAYQRRREGAWWAIAVASIAVMALVANHFLLRANLSARFGDVGPLVAVLGAAVCAGLRTPGRAVAVAVLLMAAWGVSIAGSVPQELRTAGFTVGPVGLVRRGAYVSSQIARLPDAAWSDPQASGALLVAQYVNQCTVARDRLFVLSYAPELVPLSGRLFAGGVASLVITANTPHGDAFVLRKLQGESVPIVLAESDQLDPLEGRLPGYFPRVHAYLREAYTKVGTFDIGGEPMHVLATRLRVPNGTFRATGLPCFK